MKRTSWDPLDANLWPSDSQRLLLRALLLENDDASDAWRRWSVQFGVEDAGASDRALFPGLYLAADRIGIEPAARAVLRDAYMAAWAHNTTALSLFGATARRLNAEGIPLVALKGVPLLVFHYRDVGARTMADVDALIRPRDLEAAAELLRSCGWEPVAPVPPTHVAGYLHAQTWKHRTGVELDLHWRPFTTDCPEEAERRFWNRTEQREWDGGLIRVPAAADLVVMMCFHARRQDHLARARWVVDVMRVLANDEHAIDWRAVVEQSIATGLAAPVDDALRYLREVHSVAVPDDPRLALAAREPAGRMRYFELARQGRGDRGLLETLNSKWWRYASVRRAGGLDPTLRGFASYFLADRQWEWGLNSAWQVPGRAAVKLIERVRSHGF